MSIRAGTASDAAARAAIYAPYVRDTAITFELDPPSPEEMGRRIARALASHAWVVLEGGDAGLLGYAYAGPYKERAVTAPSSPA